MRMFADCTPGFRTVDWPTDARGYQLIHRAGPRRAAASHAWMLAAALAALGLSGGVAQAEVAPDVHRIYVLGLGAQNASYDCKQGERIEGATVEIVVNTLPGTDDVSGSAGRGIEDWSCRVNWQVDPA